MVLRRLFPNLLAELRDANWIDLGAMKGIGEKPPPFAKTAKVGPPDP
jgi:hypothetical protein